MAEERVAPAREGYVDGLLIGGGTLLALLFVAHRPVASASHGAAVLDEIGRLRTADHVVHGALIALLLALKIGFVGFAETAGTATWMMRASVLLYGAGVIAALGAAVLDGFVIPNIAQHYAAAPADVQQVASILPSLRDCASRT